MKLIKTLTYTCRIVIISYHLVCTLALAADAVAIGNVAVGVVQAKVADQSCNVFHVIFTNK